MKVNIWPIIIYGSATIAWPIQTNNKKLIKKKYKPIKYKGLNLDEFIKCKCKNGNVHNINIELIITITPIVLFGIALNIA